MENQTDSIDLSTLDREALARMVAELQGQRDDLQASLAWLVNTVIDSHEIAATPDKEAWLRRAKECGKNWRRNLAEMQQRNMFVSDVASGSGRQRAGRRK